MLTGIRRHLQKRSCLKIIRRQMENISKFNPSCFQLIKNHELQQCRISVVISLYNYQNYIGTAIDSVLENHFKEVELVVVNDASTDGSLEVVKPYLSRSCNLTIIDKKLNTGLSHTRNLGIEHARGDYVFILDADNLVFPDCLGKMYDFITSNALDAAYCTIGCYDREGRFVRYVSDRAFDFQEIRKRNYIDAMAIFNKAKLIAAGSYDVQMLKSGIGWEDHELWLRLGSLNYSIGHLHEVLCKYLVKDGGMLDSTHLFIDELTAYLSKKFD